LWWTRLNSARFSPFTSASPSILIQPSAPYLLII
jgi:hypothetical protein